MQSVWPILSVSTNRWCQCTKQITRDFRQPSPRFFLYSTWKSWKLHDTYGQFLLSKVLKKAKLTTLTEFQWSHHHKLKFNLWKTSLKWLTDKRDTSKEQKDGACFPSIKSCCYGNVCNHEHNFLLVLCHEICCLMCPLPPDMIKSWSWYQHKSHNSWH